MYILLVMLWLLGKCAERRRSALWGSAILAVFVIAAVTQLATHFLQPTTEQGLRLLFMFFTGAAFYVLRRHIVLSFPIAATGTIALGLSLLYREAFFIIYNITIAYLLFWVAYVPTGLIRRFNRIGDYSYGTYIYAFPIQQLTAALIPGISVFNMIFVSGPATLALAIVSWHLIERRALNLKEDLSQSARRQIFSTLPFLKS